MTYCTGKSKAKVVVTWSSGIKETIESDKPGVDVTATISKNYRISYRHDVAPNSDNYQNSYNATKDLGELNEPISYVLQSSSDLKKNDLIVSHGSPSQQVTINITNNTVYGSIISNIQLLNDGLFTTVKVIDRNQAVISRKQLGTAIWVVTCDDDCPPGHIKCEHPGYPGFCCIPCESTALKIRNLAAKIRK